MNPFQKAYCRTYQCVLRLALPFLPYRKPTQLESIRELPSLFRQKKITSVMLITDKSIRFHGITRPLERLLSDAGIACTVYDETVANPTTVNVEDARERYLANRCQALIGFGGGSSIDCAKAVGARVAKPKQSLEQMKGILRVHKRLPLLVAIPTTAGTGSETTLAAVITDAESRHKYPINDFPLIPRYAVLDPETTRTLPASLTATTGMDALTHAVEAYIGRSTTAETRRDALQAVYLIFRYLRRAYHNGDDMVARRKMLQAAYLAGSAFSKSYVGYVHAVAHSLGGKYNIPHGLANAVLLPYVLESYGDVVYPKLRVLAVAAGVADRSDSEAEASRKFLDAVKAMQEEFHIGNKLSGIVREDVPRLAKLAAKEGNPLYPVPVLMTAKELEKFYYAVMETAGSRPPRRVNAPERGSL
ncbi:MAG: iron-containing alcohol dehydrogenase [Lachnospiraceae bacterium]|nr:iron-containing alcohol dehydrogenase [Lachnospiraceae bacterium]